MPSFVVVVDCSPPSDADSTQQLLGQALLLASHRFYASQFASPSLSTLFPRCAILASTAHGAEYLGSSEGTASSSRSFQKLRRQVLATSQSVMPMAAPTSSDVNQNQASARNLFAALQKACCFLSKGPQPSELWLLRTAPRSREDAKKPAVTPFLDMAASAVVVACVHSGIVVHVCDPTGPAHLGGRLFRISQATGGRMFSQFCEELLSVRNTKPIGKAAAQIAYAVRPADAAEVGLAEFSLCSHCFSLYAAETSSTVRECLCQRYQ
jgi:hypothetical protein